MPLPYESAKWPERQSIMWPTSGPHPVSARIESIVSLKDRKSLATRAASSGKHGSRRRSRCPAGAHVSEAQSVLAGLARIQTLFRFDALQDFLANLRIVLRHLKDRVVFLDRESPIGDRPGHRIVGLLGDALLLAGRRRG